jgi:hypothetical protein
MDEPLSALDHFTKQVFCLTLKVCTPPSRYRFFM